MNHAAFNTDHQDPGFELGWDYAHYGLVPPAEVLLPGSPVRQGWEAGCQTFGRRTLQSTRFARKWLLLRLNAWLRGRHFEVTQVTPAFLRRIDVPVCPITREVLMHGTGGPLDASVDRVNNDAGYAAGNLAVMSVRANRAKSLYGVNDAMAFVVQIERGRLGHIDGLTAEQWARVAVLASLTTPLPHERVARLPLLTLPPPRLRVLNPVQAMQVMLTLHLGRSGYAQRCAALSRLTPTLHARRALDDLTGLFLAGRLMLACRREADPARRHQWLEDLWIDPAVNRAWQSLSLQLSPEQCDDFCRRVARKGLAGPGVAWISAGEATEGWALETRGYETLATARGPILAAPLEPQRPSAEVRARETMWQEPRATWDGRLTCRRAN